MARMSPVSVSATEPVEVVHELDDYLASGPVPVEGRRGHLIGVIHNNPKGDTR